MTMKIFREILDHLFVALWRDHDGRGHPFRVEGIVDLFDSECPLRTRT